MPLTVEDRLGRLSRYADEPLTRQLAEQIAEHEHIPVEQVVLGEILDLDYFSAAPAVRAASSSIQLLVILLL